MQYKHISEPIMQNNSQVRTNRRQKMGRLVGQWASHSPPFQVMSGSDQDQEISVYPLVMTNIAMV